MEVIAGQLRGEVAALLDSVTQRVGASMHLEINSLASLLPHFPGQYREDSLVRKVYLGQLEQFLELGLARAVRGSIGRQARRAQPTDQTFKLVL